ncbi:Transcriptional repressor PaaX [Phaeobacter sp. CECT 5382]|uniref:PaaX family transcriptional regulator C-terminal domain-containing protein n=1 Tax=Phaeobacter sp. CECT 5382 TaxID=1712645 RepID=UPI0006DBCD43|nr:PaaX family transcriptional regulator C-terminal domain-containing protein [Phaeobacter sp. CECT 5382]CUH88786.1 Transcriptional repressor PaaX [Phaeobacter sp. CECT 5382]
MTHDAPDWFKDSIAQLNDPQNLRVWSIIVSLFGDLAQKPGDQISGGALTRIITPMGIKPEAIRVALHRLRKDGWIESARSGRVSVHYLTKFGRSQSAAVTPRIYARSAPATQAWHLLIAEDGSGQSALEDALLLPQYTSINRTTALGQGSGGSSAARAFEDLLVVTASDLKAPRWLQSRLFPGDLVQSCRNLEQALTTIAPALRSATEITPVQIATLRTLIVHHWRRIALRHPDLPESFHPDDWLGEACRARVFQLLDTLPQPSPPALDLATGN